MTVLYLAGLVPEWYVADNNGKPAAGGRLWTYSSQNKSLLKLTYNSADNSQPNTNPIIFNANGTHSPIYFVFDSASPNDNYYLRMEDGTNVTPTSDHGNLLWDVDNYTGQGTSSGGGGGTPNNIDIANLITNNVFWGTSEPIDTATFATGVNVVIAPGPHDSLVEGANASGSTGPDIRFIKSNTAVTDTLQYISFNGADAQALIPDVTPQYFLEYTCSAVNGGGETYKYVQFPVTPKVQNLAGTLVSGVIYAKCVSGNPVIQPYLRQFYGDGSSATPEPFPFTPFGPAITLTASWKKYTFTATLPQIGANVIGECHNDALYMCIALPINAVTKIDIVKPALYPADQFFPVVEFLTMDQISGITMSPRTGDIKTSLSATSLPGYVAMDDGSIGSTASGATTRANVDTFALYSLIWNSVINTWAPTQNSVGTPVARGASAVADFQANNRLVLPRSLGRALAGAGTGSGLTARALGQYLGTETIAIADMPAHTHGIDTYNNNTGSGAATVANPSGGHAIFQSQSTGGSGADGKMQPTSFFNVFIKL